MDPQMKKSPAALREEEILKFWEENKIFEKTLENPPAGGSKGDFVFYEGPPTANGRPGIHHLEARAFKDALPRYKTMRGFRVLRKGGWDTHGLPVELQVEKELQLQSKKEIEKYGIAAFNKKCKESVFTYLKDWGEFTRRMGYWVDQENAYFTFDNSYIETVWSVVNKASENGLLYKDYKVLPWCPRCGTALSSHELAQGYQDVKDLSVYVKFKVVGQENTYILAWTTTPWTLPGNVGLAVGEQVSYVKVKFFDVTPKKENYEGTVLEGTEPVKVNLFKGYFILAKERLQILGEKYEVVEEINGKDLIGLSYEPLYPFLKENVSGAEKEKLVNAFKVYGADFVTTTDGTGIVHTAVMYGQDDFALGTKVGLPKYHLVKEDGHFKDECGFLAGRFVKEVDANGKPTLAVDIVDDLKKRNLFFKQENYKHSYPHCWRCKTPLIYFARDSWYIAMSKLRDELVKENEKINWEPNYIKEGRFGEWLREIKDWAISRERYWGTPLPVWETADGKERLIVDSLQTLKEKVKKSGNKYFLMRHGEAEQNVAGVFSSDEEKIHHLTQKGRVDAVKTAKRISSEKIDIIFHSPLTRAKETVEEIVKTLPYKVEVIEDVRIREEGFGKVSGMKVSEFNNHFPTFKQRLDVSVGDCETLREAKHRVGEFIYDIEKKYQGKNILIVSHGGPLKLFLVVATGANDDEMESIYINSGEYIKPGECKSFEFAPLPHNEGFQLDLHRPYIDEVELVGKNGESLRRVKEVMDVWFDSGSMPYAQHADKRNGLSFEKFLKQIPYPADFISEAIDQTRGWFYTLHAIGTILGEGRAYKNVICLGHLLDKNGKKMSKSVGNVVDPFEMMDKYGADALRLWMYSINQPGESKNFDEKTVDEIVKKVFNLISNVHSFYELYRDVSIESNEYPKTKNVLDLWILARLNDVIEKNTDYLDNYKLLEPTRTLREFIEDLSVWYVRRSRDRIRDGEKEAKQTLYFVLKSVAKLLAPLAPFYAEHLYLKLRLNNDPSSVHLESWPEAKREGWFSKSDKILSNMKEVRKVVSEALEIRQRSNIKVRQPLSKLVLHGYKINDDFLSIIKDEINVKNVELGNYYGEIKVGLDTTITPELKEEGIVREIIRAIQDLRKKKNLSPHDVVSIAVDTSPELKKIIEENWRDISDTAGVLNVSFETSEGEKIQVDEFSASLEIK